MALMPSDALGVVQKVDNSLGYYDLHTGAERHHLALDPYPRVRGWGSRAYASAWCINQQEGGPTLMRQLSFLVGVMLLWAMSTLQPRTEASGCLKSGSVYTCTDTGDPVTNGANLQNTVNAASCGDTIVIPTAVEHRNATGTSGNPVVILPNKSCGTNQYITIQSSATASLPAGTRVTYANLSSMAVLRTMNQAPAIDYANGAGWIKWIGVLFTSRGCNKTCTFCQTPKFYRKPYALDVSTIEPVLAEYHRRNVTQVVILDENFGHFEGYTNEITELLHRFRFNWNPMTRVETLHKNYERWKAHGLRGASIGLESLNQDSLDAAKKGNDLTKGRELLEWMKRDRMLVQTFYIIGFEQDTEESIRQNIRELKQYHIDSPQIQILTPQPETILFKHIERTYGIITYDYSKYDTTNLVWHHPNIAPRRLQELMFWANDELFTATNSLRTATKVASQAIGNVLARGWRGFSLPPVWSGNIDTLAVPLSELVTYGSRARAGGH